MKQGVYMNILQVSNYFKPSFESGGVARSVFNISKCLAENGHDVTVYTTNKSLYDTNVQTNKESYVDGIKVYYFENLRKYFKNNLPLPYYSPIIVRKQIKTFDIIHIHEHRTILAIVVHHYAKKYGIPYILQPRGSIPKMSKNIQKSIFDLLFGKKIIDDALIIIASSKIESDQYKQAFPGINNEKIIHMPNGLDLEEYHNLPVYGCFRNKHSINPNDKIILFLSRIHERKGADVLTEAFYQLKNNLHNIKLVIAGPDHGYLNNLKLIVKKYGLEDDVLFTGSLHGTDKLEVYVDADVFVLPSKDKYESFGNVVLEAMACGTPVVITNNCGVSEWIPNTFGYVVESDVNSLSDAMLKILNKDVIDNIQIDNIQKNDKELLFEIFDWKKICGDLEIIYRKLSEGYLLQ